MKRIISNNNSHDNNDITYYVVANMNNIDLYRF